MNRHEEITITQGMYDALVRDQYLLQCLMNGGVDNWEWYGEAIAEFNVKYGDD